MDIGPGDRVRALYDVSAADGINEDHAMCVGSARIVAGCIYTVDAIIDGSVRGAAHLLAPEDYIGITLTAPETRWVADDGGPGAWALRLFRKLPDISEWLETSTSYEEPRRVPAPREVEGV